MAETRESARQGNFSDGVLRFLKHRFGTLQELKPGGYHVMLMNLKHQLKEGEAVPITLVVEGKDGKRETIEVKAPVRALAEAKN